MLAGRTAPIAPRLMRLVCLVAGGANPVLFRYPRFCLVRWHDHDHAAFYPAPGAAPPARYTARHVVGFAERFLSDPAALLVATEHF